jgi:hypothetical protein
MALVFMVSTVGCGQGFRATSVGSNTAASAGTVDISEQLAKAEDARKQAQAAMADAKAAIDQISDDQGNINIGLFQTSETQTQGLLSPIIDKLNGVFDKLFAKIDFVKQQFTTARAALTAALAQLNQANPLQAAQIQQIMAEMSQIDAMEAQFQSSMHLLADKLDLASAALDKLINSATSFIPVPGLSIVAGVLIDMFVMSDVKNLIASLKARLLAV